MKRWADGHYTLFANELTVEIIEAPDWHSAAMKHSKIEFGPEGDFDHLMDQVNRFVRELE
jgi:hypothetical protein